MGKRSTIGLALGLSVVMLLGVSPLTLAALSKRAMQTAVTLYRQGEYQQALQRFESLQKETPADGRPLYYQALCLVQLGQLQEAHKRYRSVTILYPNSDAATYAQRGLKMLAALQQPDPELALDAPPPPSSFLSQAEEAETAPNLAQYQDTPENREAAWQRRQTEAAYQQLAVYGPVNPENPIPLRPVTPISPQADQRPWETPGQSATASTSAPGYLPANSPNASNYSGGIRPSDVGMAPQQQQARQAAYANQTYPPPSQAPQQLPYPQPGNAQQGYGNPPASPYGQPPNTPPVNGMMPANPMQTNTMPTMPMQNPMMLMMMMNQGQGGNGGGGMGNMGWMLPMMMQGQGAGGMGQQDMNPELMKQMMMNSMMGSMDFGMNSGNDR